MLRKTMLIGALVATTGFSHAALARNDAVLGAAIGAGVGAFIGSTIANQPRIYSPPPAVVYTPAPVYAQPPVVYSSPVVIYEQRPVYVSPAPVRYYGYSRGYRGYERHIHNGQYRRWDRD